MCFSYHIRYAQSRMHDRIETFLHKLMAHVRDVFFAKVGNWDVGLDRGVDMKVKYYAIVNNTLVICYICSLTIFYIIIDCNIRLIGRRLDHILTAILLMPKAVRLMGKYFMTILARTIVCDFIATRQVIFQFLRCQERLVTRGAWMSWHCSVYTHSSLMCLYRLFDAFEGLRGFPWCVLDWHRNGFSSATIDFFYSNVNAIYLLGWQWGCIVIFLRSFSSFSCHH